MGAKEWVETVLEIAKEHGAPGVSLVLAYLLFKYGHKVKPILDALRARLPVPSKAADELEAAIEMVENRIDALVNKAMQILVYKYDACRAFVFEYEDYDDRIKPLSWLYCSNTYEYCNPTRDVRCHKESLQRLPMAAIKYWARELGTSRQICLHDVAEIRETDMESYKILQNQQISSVYCASMDDFCGAPLGFIGLDYCRGHPSRVQCDADMQSLAMEGVKIAGLIALKKNGTREQLAGKL